MHVGARRRAAIQHAARPSLARAMARVGRLVALPAVWGAVLDTVPRPRISSVSRKAIGSQRCRGRYDTA